MSTSIVINLLPNESNSAPSINVVNGKGRSKNTISIDEFYANGYKIHQFESLEFYKELVEFVIKTNRNHYDGFAVLQTKFVRNPYVENQLNFDEVDVVIDGYTYTVKYRWIALIPHYLIEPERKYFKYKLEKMEKSELLSILFDYMVSMDIEKRNQLLSNIGELSQAELVQILVDEIEVEHESNLQLFYSAQFPKMIYVDHMIAPNALSYEPINKWIYFCPEEYVSLGEWIASIVKIEK